MVKFFDAQMCIASVQCNLKSRYAYYYCDFSHKLSSHMPIKLNIRIKLKF